MEIKIIILEIVLKTQNFASMRLPAQGMTYDWRCCRQTVLSSFTVWNRLVQSLKVFWRDEEARDLNQGRKLWECFVNTENMHGIKFGLSLMNSAMTHTDQLACKIYYYG
jgi:hypothetical protein